MIELTELNGYDLHGNYHNQDEARQVGFTLTLAGHYVRIRNDAPNTWSVWVKRVTP